jgi:undecaprenyl-diphosphatase
MARFPPTTPRTLSALARPRLQGTPHDACWVGSARKSAPRLQMYRELDVRILDWLRARRSPALTRTMRAATRLGSVEVLAPVSLLATLALGLGGKRRAAGFVAATASVATATNLSLKALFGRSRPNVQHHLSRTSGLSFPSGHAMASAAIYGALALVAAESVPAVRWLSRFVSVAASAGVGSSRVYLHVHYPSDVAVGWALGAALPFAFKRLFRI